MVLWRVGREPHSGEGAEAESAPTGAGGGGGRGGGRGADPKGVADDHQRHQRLGMPRGLRRRDEDASGGSDGLEEGEHPRQGLIRGGLSWVAQEREVHRSEDRRLREGVRGGPQSFPSGAGRDEVRASPERGAVPRVGVPGGPQHAQHLYGVHAPGVHRRRCEKVQSASCDHHPDLHPADHRRPYLPALSEHRAPRHQGGQHPSGQPRGGQAGGPGLLQAAARLDQQDTWVQHHGWHPVLDGAGGDHQH
mmetsp:Transcript_11189/g.20147  ORF Transcript_11189/g.20147 Transcript_11189/m.20147 type:complete len:249 (+) Transcript_11189:707-1453(+)